MTFHALITNFLEIIAAFSGFYFLRKNKDSKMRYFVYFLVFTISVEALASYTHLYDKVGFLKVLEETKFRSNFWLFNIYIIISLLFYIKFYKRILKYSSHKKILKSLFIISLFVIPICTYIERDGFFNTNLSYNFIWTTFSVFICVSLYFYELLMSDNLLSFHRSTLFYISIGLLLWWLVFPPVAFYFPYYKETHPEMVNLKGTILILTNVYLYGCYTIGFLWGKEK